MKKAEREDIFRFLEQEVIPLIEKHYPDVASEMIVHVNDFAAGTGDLPHHPDAIIYLEDRLWASKGGHVQLLLETSLEAWEESEGIDGSRHCVGAWVHPLSWLRELRRFLDTRAEAPADLPWEEIPVERFYEVQHAPVLRDTKGVFAHLKDATRPELYPSWLWEKHLIVGLRELMENLCYCQRALLEGRGIEANIMLSGVIPDALRLGFFVHRRYYPAHPHLRWAFEQLPAPADAVLAHVDTAASSGDPAGRLAALTAARDIYIAHVADKNLLPTLNLKSPNMGLGDLGPWEELHQELLWAGRCEAGSNPKWRDWVTDCQRQAAEAGHAEHWWIYSLWDIKRKVSHI